MRKTQASKDLQRQKLEQAKQRQKQQQLDAARLNQLNRYPRKKAKRKKNNSGKLLIAVAIALFLLIVGGIGFIVYNASYEKLTLADYSVISVSGFDGNGTANVEVNATEPYEEFFKTVKASLNQTEKLGNGDEVIISYEYDEALAKSMKLRINGTASSATIAGLPEGKVVHNEDLFDNLQITYAGISPCIKIEFENLASDPFLQSIEYEILSEKEHYKNGDTFVIQAKFNEEDAIKRAYDIEPGEDGYQKTYTIGGFDAYITDASQITPDMLEQLYADGVKLFTSDKAREYGLRIYSEAGVPAHWEGRKTTFSWGNLRVLSAYFNVVTEEAIDTMIGTHCNDVRIVYEVPLSQATGETVMAEAAVQYTDLLIKVDGTVDLKLGEGKIIGASAKNKNIKSLVSDTNSGNYINIKLE